MIFREPKLNFDTLTERRDTNFIVIHHSNGGNDVDFSVEDIHRMHRNIDYAGCGYHFVIRKNGTIERGRPEWAVGAHAEGFNSDSIGICFSGDFQRSYPSDAQIAACVELLRDLCNAYDIPCDRKHILGHRELNETDCPGQNLFSWLEEICYRVNNPPAEIKSDYKGKPVTDLFDLAERYESNGDPATVGKFFGALQFNHTTTKTFVDWLKKYPDDALANYGRVLAETNDFQATWREIGTIDPGNFIRLQYEFATEIFFGEACSLLAEADYRVDKHTLRLRAVVFSRAIQHGVFGCLELFKRACPYPNLSYADAPEFDRQIIAAVYDYLIAHPNFGLATHDHDETLRNRFIREKADALA